MAKEKDFRKEIKDWADKIIEFTEANPDKDYRDYICGAVVEGGDGPGSNPPPPPPPPPGN